MGIFAIAYHSLFLVTIGFVVNLSLQGYREGDIATILSVTFLLILYIFLSMAIQLYILSNKGNKSSGILFIYFLFSTILGVLGSGLIYLFSLII